MPNGRTHKAYEDYGSHDYEGHVNSPDCRHECGCWATGFQSGGPLGLDPFGHCPNNPLDGIKQSGSDDHEDCVNGRINMLETALHQAEKSVAIIKKAKKETKIDLVNRLEHAEQEKEVLMIAVSQLKEALSEVVKGIAHIGENL